MDGPITIRLVLSTDNALMRSGLCARFDREPDIDVVGDVVGGHSLITAIRAHAPDVVLLIGMVEAKPKLAEIAAAAKVIVVATEEDVTRGMELVRAGVRGLLSSGCSPFELLCAIRIVAVGNRLVLPPQVFRGIELVAPGPVAPHLDMRVADSLTRREAEVLRLLAHGRSNAEIARQLSVSMTTIRSHVHHLLQKLEVSTRGQAVAVAYESGLIELLTNAAAQGDSNGHRAIAPAPRWK